MRHRIVLCTFAIVLMAAGVAHSFPPGRLFHHHHHAPVIMGPAPVQSQSLGTALGSFALQTFLNQLSQQPLFHSPATQNPSSGTDAGGSKPQETFVSSTTANRLTAIETNISATDDILKEIIAMSPKKAQLERQFEPLKKEKGKIVPAPGGLDAVQK